MPSGCHDFSVWIRRQAIEYCCSARNLGRCAGADPERLIGSIRRDCLDHVVVFGERHLRHLLNSYQKYCNEARTHLSLHKDAPITRTIQTVGRTLAMRVLGGQYFRA